jgi:hypothetical protein
MTRIGGELAQDVPDSLDLGAVAQVTEEGCDSRSIRRPRGADLGGGNHAGTLACLRIASMTIR